MIDFEIDYGDSRTPEDIRNNVHCMHTNSMVCYLRWHGTWYRCHNINILYYKELFKDCKTEEDYQYFVDQLLKEHEIFLK